MPWPQSMYHIARGCTTEKSCWTWERPSSTSVKKSLTIASGSINHRSWGQGRSSETCYNSTKMRISSRCQLEVRLRLSLRQGTLRNHHHQERSLLSCLKWVASKSNLRAWIEETWRKSSVDNPPGKALTSRTPCTRCKVSIILTRTYSWRCMRLKKVILHIRIQSADRRKLPAKATRSNNSQVERCLISLLCLHQNFLQLLLLGLKVRSNPSTCQASRRSRSNFHQHWTNISTWLAEPNRIPQWSCKGWAWRHLSLTRWEDWMDH